MPPSPTSVRACGKSYDPQRCSMGVKLCIALRTRVVHVRNSPVDMQVGYVRLVVHKVCGC